MPRNNRSEPRNRGLARATRGFAGSHDSRRNEGAGRPGAVRIIGGTWRGRKLPVPSTSDTLRPTPDRVRETLFNWLQFEVPGRRCLDLFAGSGALGFEALSRGASFVTFVETDPEAARSLEASLARLRCDRARVVRSDAFQFLRSDPHRAPCDIVFLDPPWRERWLARACAALEQGGWLTSGSWIYLEDAAEHGPPAMPDGWSLLRSKKAGDVGYHLARRGEAHTRRADRVDAPGGP